MPRFFEENFDKNVVLADKIKAIADKYQNLKATPSNLSLAWILAEHPKCRLFSTLVCDILMTSRDQSFRFQAVVLRNV